jgi:DNA-binding MarR family transcriptional regulator
MTDVADLPPSAGYVLDVIERDGPLSRQQLLEETYLAERSLDRALTTLETRDLIEKQALGRTILCHIGD